MAGEDPWERSTYVPAPDQDGAADSEPWERSEGEDKPVTALGLGKSLTSGAAKGAINLAAAPGQLENFIEEHNPFSWMFREYANHMPGLPQFTRDALNSQQDFRDKNRAKTPTGAEGQQAVQELTGVPFHLPENRVEKYVDKIGEMVPGSLLGGEGVGLKLLQAATAGTGAEGGRELLEGSGYEGAGEFLGGIIGGGVGGAFAERGAESLARTQKIDNVIGAYERLGLHPTAGTTGVGGETMAAVEGNVLPQLVGSRDRILNVHTKNREQTMEQQQNIAQQYGAPAPNKMESGKAAQQGVTTRWQGARKQAGDVLNSIGEHFEEHEEFEVPNLVAALEKPVGAPKSPLELTNENPMSVSSMTASPPAGQSLVSRGNPLTEAMEGDLSSLGSNTAHLDLQSQARALSEKWGVETPKTASEKAAEKAQSNVVQLRDAEKARAGARSRLLGEMTTDSLVQQMRDLLQKSNGRLKYDEMKALITRFGNAVDRSFGKNISDAQISQMEHALREDLKDVIATRGPELAKAWEKAGKDYREEMINYRSAFKKLIENQDVPMNGEKVYNIIVGAASTGGQTNLRLFKTVWDYLGKEQQGNLSAYILSRMGYKDGDNLQNWSLAKFITDFGKLTPEAKELLFKSTGNMQTQKALEDLHTVMQSMSITDKVASTSRSGMSAQMLAQGTAPLILAFSGNVTAAALTAVGTIAGPWAAARFTTSPTAIKAFAQSLERLHQATAHAAKAMIPLTANAMEGDVPPPTGNGPGDVSRAPDNVGNSGPTRLTVYGDPGNAQ